MVVDDQEAIRLFLEATLGDEGFAVKTASSGRQALLLTESIIPDLVLLDIRLPDMSGLDVLASLRQRFPHLCVVVLTAFSESDSAVRAMKLGAYEYLGKPINLERLLTVVKRGVASTESARERFRLQRNDDLFAGQDGIVPSAAPAMRRIYETIHKVAPGRGTTVLIEGESGVGKDVIANAIHANSDRCDSPFLEINCASLPETLLESELFGHEKGAFTDAVRQKQGLLELAHTGTVFLDEIGEMSLPIQVKLLRILEKMKFRRVGGVEDIEVDVRVIAATNRTLTRLVAENSFREDLFYRLKVIYLRVPPLRTRPEDIPLLAEHFLAEFNQAFGKNIRTLGADALTSLQQYHWPGNIRELRNVLERSVLLEDGETLTRDMLHLEDHDSVPPDLAARVADVLANPLPADGIELTELIEGVEAALVRKAVQSARGNQSQAARLLGLNRDKLRYRLKQYGIKPG